MGILEVVVAVTVVGLGAATISFRPPSLLHVPPRYEYEYEFECEYECFCFIYILFLLILKEVEV